MAAYRFQAYRRSSGFRSYRRPGSGVHPAVIVGAVAAVAALTASHAKAGHATAARSVVTRAAAARPARVTTEQSEVIAFARARLGDPYVWGGTGPYGYDCSGLALKAWASAGVWIDRTSQQQWASERHVSSPQPGDLVFFAGGDGTPEAPGHVGIVTDPAEHKMIDAYTTGTPVRYDTYGLTSSAPGLNVVVGFTAPGGE